MPTRHETRFRALLAFALAASLLPLVVAAPVEAVCPAPVAAMPTTPTGCCPGAAPPACPSCPSEGRPACPSPQPSRTRTCCSLAVLPPGETTPETREARTGESKASASETAAATPARVATRARRAAVATASPPPRLLACTFRN